MANPVLFLDMFAAWKPAERDIWEQVQVRDAEIDPEERRVSVAIYSPNYLTKKVRQAAMTDLKALYGVHRLELNPVYPSAAVCQAEAREMADVMIMANASARIVLAGSRWECTEEKITISLAANGKEHLEQCLPRLRDYLKHTFSISPEIEIIAHQVDGDALFEETAKIRQEALRSVPSPTFKDRAGKTAGEGKSAPEMPADLIFGRTFSGDATPMSELNLDMFKVIVEGEVFAVNHRELKKRNAWVICFDMTDQTNSVRINQFMEADKAKPILERIAKPGGWLRIQGKMTFDRYDNEMVMQPLSIMVGKKKSRMDLAPEKRVELHLHTTMSSMDALTVTGKVIAQAAAWGHRAIAITDHGIVQSYPDALKASKNKVAGTDEPIKILYGCEAYYVNDVDDRIVVHGDRDIPLDGEFVAFDLETTGLSNQTDVITEIGAVIYKNGEILDRFQSFVNPHRKLDAKIIDLTGITDDMLLDAPDIDEVLPAFLEFCGDRPLAAHNADFDVGFILAACEQLGISYDPTYVDTLIMAQNLLPELKNHKLNIVAEALSLPEFNHHRAVDDGVTVAHMLTRFLEMLDDKGIQSIQQINPVMMDLRAGGHILDRQARHMILFAKNQLGLRNLYRLISYAHLKYYRRVPRIPK